MTNNTTQEAYAVQHLPNLRKMSDIVQDISLDRTIDIDKERFLEQGLIEHLRTGQTPQEFNKKEIYAGLKLCVANAKAAGPQSCMALPDKPNKAGVRRIATELKHTILAGKRVGTKLNLLLHGLAQHRRQIRRDAKAAELEIVKAAGQEWYAEGIKLADGTLRAFTDMMQAMKAWIRNTYGAQWYADPVKKAEYLQEAVSKVSQS